MKSWAGRGTRNRAGGGGPSSARAESVQYIHSRSAAEVVATLRLQPHREGGFFRETYRSPISISTPAGPRALCTAILYLLTQGGPSRFHRLRFDEMWFFHAGSTAEIVLLDPWERHVIGPDAPQAVVPRGRWMAACVAEAATISGSDESSRLVAAGGRTLDWALVCCVVSPGFEYGDFEAGERRTLLAAYPEAAEYIRRLS